MKSILFAGLVAAAMTTAGSAGAADLIRYRNNPPVAAAPEPMSWTGCYVGSHSGLAAGHTTWQDTVPLGTIDATMSGQTANTDMSGAIYGAQVGCSYQFSPLVIGLEGSVSASTLTGTNMDQFNATWTLRTKNDWIASITGRAGFAVDRVLVYTRGGVAWAHNKFEIENTAILDGTPSTTRVGWVIGSGIEWAFAPCWSVFLETDYYSFNGTNVSFAGDLINPTPAFTVKTTQTVETAKFGVNYRFGGASGPLTSWY
jgi:outer membrane immunogenic protein